MTGAAEPRLVLASASPRRRELLASLGVPFVCDAPDADETLPAGAAPADAARALAERKARIVAGRTELPVLAADTLVVAADGAVLGKPATSGEALVMLGRLSGTTHQVVTGVCLLAARDRPPRTAADTTRVTMRRLSAAEMEAYAASGEPFGKAGGYALQERGDRFVTSLDGSRSNVVGLPLETVERLLRAEELL